MRHDVRRRCHNLDEEELAAAEDSSDDDSSRASSNLSEDAAGASFDL